MVEGCHNGHKAESQGTVPYGVDGPVRGVDGVPLDGACHGRGDECALSWLIVILSL